MSRIGQDAVQFGLCRYCGKMMNEYEMLRLQIDKADGVQQAMREHMITQHPDTSCGKAEIMLRNLDTREGR